MEKIAQGHGQETRKCAPVCKVNFAQTFGCNSFLLDDHVTWYLHEWTSTTSTT